MSARSTLVVALSVLLVATTIGGALLAVTGDTTAQQQNAGNVTIQVSAAGEVTAQPDVAILAVAVTATAENATDARDRVAENASQLQTALTEAGLDADRIRTSYFAIHEVENESGDRQVRAAHGYELHVPVNRSGELLDLAVDSGATQVDGVSFTLADETRETLRQEALEHALTNARTDADTLANATGLSVASIHSIETSDVGFGPVFETDARAATEFTPGPVTVSATVSVTYVAE